MIAQHHGLKPTALDQFAGRVGNEAVEQAVGPVLGQIDDACAGIDTDRLVVEPAHGLQRDRIDQALGARRHLEDIAVFLGHVRVGGRFLRLLAGQPRAPRCLAAAAVGAGARQAEVLAFGLAGRHVVDDCGRAAGQGAAVLVGVIGAARIQQTDSLLVVAAGTPVAVRRRRTLEFVIADQGDPASIKGETAHAVELAGDQQAVGHGLAALGHDAVGEALGQVEHAVGITLQRTVALDLVDVGFLGGRLDAVGQAREGEGGAGADQAATVKDHERAPREDRSPDGSERSWFDDEGRYFVTAKTAKTSGILIPYL